MIWDHSKTFKIVISLLCLKMLRNNDFNRSFKLLTVLKDALLRYNEFNRFTVVQLFQYFLSIYYSPYYSWEFNVFCMLVC